jgi:putative transposase
MPNYRRVFAAGGCWFFTANLLDRRSCLLADQIEALREATRRTRERHPSSTALLRACAIGRSRRFTGM